MRRRTEVVESVRVCRGMGGGSGRAVALGFVIK